MLLLPSYRVVLCRSECVQQSPDIECIDRHTRTTTRYTHSFVPPILLHPTPSLSSPLPAISSSYRTASSNLLHLEVAEERSAGVSNG